MTINPSLIGTEFTLRNYITVFSTSGFGRNIVNSLVLYIRYGIAFDSYCIFDSVCHDIFPKVQIKQAYYVFLAPCTDAPFSCNYHHAVFVYWKLGILNTYIAMILTYSCGGGLAVPVIMLCGYYGEIPKDLLDSAYIDGANAFKAFTKSFLPLAAPGLLCTAIYVFILTWQEFPAAQNLITDTSMYNVTVGLSAFSRERWQGLGSDHGGVHDYYGADADYVCLYSELFY